MPKQNRPTVRDGRIQAPKKRTDRSYLSPAASPAESAVAEAPEAASEVTPEPNPVAEPVAAGVPPAAAAIAGPPATAPASAARLTGTARALQQQGVRKRREYDVQALAVRDTKYAYHELRRIAILATMVVVTLVVLTFVLR